MLAGWIAVVGMTEYEFGSVLLGRQGQMGCVVNHTCGSKSLLLCSFSEDCGRKLSFSWFFLRAGKTTIGRKRWK